MTAAELVERVALVIWRNWRGLELIEVGRPGSAKSIADAARSEARAAIAETLAAIRDPTEAMSERGATALLAQRLPVLASDCGLVWRSMLDALAAELRDLPR